MLMVFRIVMGCVFLLSVLPSLHAQNGIFNIGFPTPTSALPNAVKGVEYKLYFSVEDGVAPFTVSVSGGLPRGLSFTPKSFSGNVLGEPTYVASTYLDFTGTVATSAGVTSRMTISVTDSSPMPQTLSVDVSVSINEPPTIMTYSPTYAQYKDNVLNYAVSGQQYGTTIDAFGGPGTPGYKWKIEDADPGDPFIGPSTISKIKPGLTSFEGLITSPAAVPSGLARPKQAYRVNVSFWHDDYPTLVATQEFLIFVVDPLEITTEELPYAFGDEDYEVTFEGQGAASSLELEPDEQTMVANGELIIAERLLEWTIEDANPDVTPDGPKEDPVLEESGLSLSASSVGGQGQSVWAIPLANGYINNQGAILSGTINPDLARSFDPDKGGYQPYEVKVTLSVKGRSEVTPVVIVYELHIFESLSVATPVAPLGDATAGEDYELDLGASGGTEAKKKYDWSKTADTLPSGLSVEQDPDDYTWKVTGFPDFGIASPEEVFQVAFTVENEGPRGDQIVATKVLPLKVVELQLSTTPTIETNAIAGVAFEASLLLTGRGVAPFTWSITEGALPSGLAVEERGGAFWFLSGIPDYSAISSDPYAFTLSVADSASPRSHRNEYSYELYVLAPELVVLTSNFPPATEGEGYSLQLEAVGVPPYSWQVSGLPDGMDLVVDETSGEAYVEGTPQSGSAQGHVVQIIVTDGQMPASLVSLRTLFTVLPDEAESGTEPLVIQNSALPVATEGEEYGPVPLLVTGGSGTYSWEESYGLPPGVALQNSEGQWALVGVPRDGSAGIWLTALRVRDQVYPELVEQIIFTFVIAPDLITPESEQSRGPVLSPESFLADGAPAGCSLNTWQQPNVCLSLLGIVFCTLALLFKSRRRIRGDA